LLAGSKQGPKLYQGIIFLIPFFFLLEDSSLESTGAILVAAGLSVLLEDVVVAG
jgi:hypothetical protein